MRRFLYIQWVNGQDTIHLKHNITVNLMKLWMPWTWLMLRYREFESQLDSYNSPPKGLNNSNGKASNQGQGW